RYASYSCPARPHQGSRALLAGRDAPAGGVLLCLRRRLSCALSRPRFAGGPSLTGCSTALSVSHEKLPAAAWGLTSLPPCHPPRHPPACGMLRVCRSAVNLVARPSYSGRAPAAPRAELPEPALAALARRSFCRRLRWRGRLGLAGRGSRLRLRGSGRFAGECAVGECLLWVPAGRQRFLLRGAWSQSAGGIREGSRAKQPRFQRAELSRWIGEHTRQTVLAEQPVERNELEGALED